MSPVYATEEMIVTLITQLQLATKGMVEPASALIVQRYGRDPFKIFVACILSLRTRDPVSFAAACRLFDEAHNPYQMSQINLSVIKDSVKTVNFYQRKAFQIQRISHILIDQYGGEVPHTQKELLALPGVGLKTANLVLSEAFNIPALVVDTHVHRVSNRLGLVHTKTPEQTEKALSVLIPSKYWIKFSKLILMWGQNICGPVSPKCSACVLRPVCPQIGVTRSR